MIKNWVSEKSNKTRAFVTRQWKKKKLPVLKGK